MQDILKLGCVPTLYLKEENLLLRPQVISGPNGAVSRVQQLHCLQPRPAPHKPDHLIFVIRQLDREPRTDDAFVQADTIGVAAQVSGRIVSLKTRDNAMVAKGDVLFTIDARPYELDAERLRAQLATLEAQIGLTERQVDAQRYAAEAAGAGVARARQNAAQRQSTLQRMEPLLADEFVTREQVDQARTAQRTAQLGLQQARLQADEARQAIINTKPTEAELDGARATLALAERDLNKTVVRAPCDGRITALDIAAGEFAAIGHPLFTIIDSEHWYAIGNFRETDLPGMEPGQRATVYVMAQPSRPLPATNGSSPLSL